MSAVAKYAGSALKKHWVNLSLIVLKNIIGSFLHLLPPILSKYVLDSVLPQHNMSLLLIVTISMVAAPITGSMMIILENMWGRFMLKLASKGRSSLFNGIQHQPLSWHNESRTGDLMTRILDDTRFITEMVNGQIGFTLFHLVTIITGGTILIMLQPELGGIVLALWVGQSFVMSRLSNQVKRKAAENARQQSIVSEKVRELVSSAPFIKASGHESKAIRDLQLCLDQEWSHTRRSVIVDYRVRLLLAILNACTLVLMYSAGGWFVLQDWMTVGSLVAFIAVFNWLRPFGVSLIERSLSIWKLPPAIGRIQDIAFTVKDQHDSGMIPSGPVHLECQGLSLRYGDREVLHDLNLCLPAGSVISIVGPRGAGKSTLSDLFLGLIHPTSGNVRLNGTPLTEVNTDWLRSHMLCVTQDVKLRSGSILDNILFGEEGIDLEEVREAVRIADLENWIMSLQEGWNTQVGENALQISGGERQRISIARALIRKPKILILDEATASLDQGTERRLLDRLLQECKGTSLLFITHRLEIGLRSNEIWVMDEGRIVDKGTHEKLINRTSLYRELWAAQGT